MTEQTVTALNHDERNVSPVTGVILTITITIVLAAAITGFMLIASSAVS